MTAVARVLPDPRAGARPAHSASATDPGRAEQGPGRPGTCAATMARATASVVQPCAIASNAAGGDAACVVSDSFYDDREFRARGRAARAGLQHVPRGLDGGEQRRAAPSQLQRPADGVCLGRSGRREANGDAEHRSGAKASTGRCSNSGESSAQRVHLVQLQPWQCSAGQRELFVELRQGMVLTSCTSASGFQSPTYSYPHLLEMVGACGEKPHSGSSAAVAAPIARRIPRRGRTSGRC